MRLLFLALLLQIEVAAQVTFHTDITEDWRLSSDRDSPGTTTRVPLQSPPAGLFWLRRTIDLPAGSADGPLTLVLGRIPGDYEVFVNGHWIGSTPGFQSNFTSSGAPKTFAVPPGLIAGDRKLIVALHVEGTAKYEINHNDHSETYLLTSPAIAALAVDKEIARWRVLDVPGLIVSVVNMLLSVVLFLVWKIRRDWWAPLWLGIFHACYAASVVLIASNSYVPYGDMRWRGIASEALSGEGYVAFLGFTFLILEVKRFRAWVGFAAIWPFLTATLAYQPTSSMVWLPADLSSIGVAAAFSTWGLFRAKRENRAILLLTSLFCWSFLASTTFRVVSQAVIIGPLSFATADWIQAIIGVLMVGEVLRRFAVDRREKQRLSGEMEAARVVQQLMLSNRTDRMDGIVVDARYEPAQEVGGDFYCILDDAAALVMVAGDVSGKGLKSAMLVAMLIGALRNMRERRPADVLQALNTAILGQTFGGFVTCCCARFDADGQVTIANAGHPAPYCDGREVELEPGLPLGIEASVQYTESAVAGSSFTFVSDGVIEAENAQRELFGFERTREISGKSAHEIAEAARTWGQNDNITVVTIRRSKAS